MLARTHRVSLCLPPPSLLLLTAFQLVWNTSIGSSCQVAWRLILCRNLRSISEMKVGFQRSVFFYHSVLFTLQNFFFSWTAFRDCHSSPLEDCIGYGPLSLTTISVRMLLTLEAISREIGREFLLLLYQKNWFTCVSDLWPIVDTVVPVT